MEDVGDILKHFFENQIWTEKIQIKGMSISKKENWSLQILCFKFKAKSLNFHSVPKSIKFSVRIHKEVWQTIPLAGNFSKGRIPKKWVVNRLSLGD